MKEILIAALVLAVGCSTVRSTKDIPVVRNFEAARYMGVWHEIARLPKWFERGLDNVTATCSLEGDRLKIVNRGFRDGKEVVSTAVGKFAGATDEGAFRVSFVFYRRRLRRTQNCARFKMSSPRAKRRLVVLCG